ncbi:MAG: hypothetical protein QOG23_297 [Blastocatellia bacterium]|jgi:hypothetical protein|nr:hypothetical protein [Blastocatellia bacterium]
MPEATESGQQAPNTAIIKGSNGRQLSMSEFAEDAHEYGRKIVDAASRAGDFVSEKVNVVGDKIKNLQGKDINQLPARPKTMPAKTRARQF